MDDDTLAGIATSYGITTAVAAAVLGLDAYDATRVLDPDRASLYREVLQTVIHTW